MSEPTRQSWASRKCQPCGGGGPRLTLEEAAKNMASLHDWRLDREKHRLTKRCVVKTFMDGIDFFQRIAQVAEAEGHHPDLHLEDYRFVQIELYTHVLGGLSENDFVLAAKIDALPVELWE
jgi:4a-hydroxytetrahydrobiopterin dehydratase